MNLLQKFSFGPEPGQEVPNEIIGLSASMSSLSVFINVKHRGLFAYGLDGQLRWTHWFKVAGIGHLLERSRDVSIAVYRSCIGRYAK